MNIEKAKEIKKQILSEFKNGLYYQFESDNTILFTVEVYALFHELGIFDQTDALNLKNAIFWLYRRKSGGQGADIVKGLFNRNPGRDDRKDQWDNYEAIAATVMFGSKFKHYSEEIDDYGKKFYIPSYDNRSPNRFSAHSFFKPFPNWLYFECCRQGWHTFTYRAYADRYVGVFNFLWFAGKVFVENNDPNETTGKLISWLRYKAVGHKRYVKPFKWLFDRKIKKLYGDQGIVEAFKIYHGEDSSIYKLAKCLL